MTKGPRRRGWARRWLRRLAVAAVLLVLAFSALWLAFPFPAERLEGLARSPQVEDRDGGLLLQLVGSDGQWRVPVPLGRMGPWLPKATIAVEDKRFRDHLGVDPWAALRAAGQNARALRVVSGASTLTMQVARMLEDRPRTWAAKALEAFRALQLERLRSKDQILETYLNLAPYGGNVRGVEAASRAWFGKSAQDLSLGEAALLAGIPQSPGRLRPDRRPEAALARRRTVLDRMVETGVVDRRTADRAAAEPLVLASRRVAPRAWHAAFLALAERPGGGRTTIDPRLQEAAEALVRAHLATLPEGAEVAVVAIDAASAEVRALVGSPDPSEPRQGQVNGATAWRSPGSALKPFLYAAAMEDGRLAPESIVHDVPIHRDGWSPENFDRTFAGEVSVADALRRSLNVPAILVAEGTGLRRCIALLEDAGVVFARPPETRSGLALAVGGSEVRLLDLTNAYATFARGGTWAPARLFADAPRPERRALSPAVCAAIDDVLSSRRRRPAGLDEVPDAAIPWFAWKTGTSSGRRDAWALGHNGRLAVGVWVGDFTGGGRPEFTGARAAEPLLARLFAAPETPRGVEPPAAPRLAVPRPLPPPVERTGTLRILSPEDRGEYAALGGIAAIPLRSTGGEDLVWFLDGRVLAPVPYRLDLPPGAYTLRLADPAGRATSVSFTVR